ncbi:MAG: GNAT family N-acetyltransferase [Caldilineaceae bacterium]|nr:GNAT family N-acetyltransferase [Caldilineaceae bacterium]
MENATRPAIYLRGATAADQPGINALIRKAGINPMNLDWRRFVVVEEMAGAEKRLIGAGQIKAHRGGVRELASIAVAPEWQGMGVGRTLVATLLSLEDGPLYLYCANHNEAYYQQFGFRALAGDQIPPALRYIYLVGNSLLRLVSLITGDPRSIVVMYRP